MTARGPDGYENWLAKLRGEPAGPAWETALYTDARLTGEVDDAHRPYCLLNTVHTAPRSGAFVGAVLRVDQHMAFGPGDFGKTDVGRYHGGNLDDELAALWCLLLGRRLRAGEKTRWFDPATDPDARGRPRISSFELTLPHLPLARGRVVPYRGETPAFNECLPRFDSYPRLEPRGAVALVRSATMYSQALWTADSDPNMAWLLLVGAIEVAAGYRTLTKSTAQDVARLSCPATFEVLDRLRASDAELELVAGELAPKQKAKQKFLDFLADHAPSAPAARPGETWGVVEWTGPSLRNAFSKIYGYRSRALHDATPFPLPMCDIPYAGKDGPPAERPWSATSAKGATWKSEDLPMYLHVFEYIVRESLLRWWDSLGPAEAVSPGVPDPRAAEEGSGPGDTNGPTGGES